jgi:hypothetical protein
VYEAVQSNTYACSNALPALLYCMWWRVIVHIERVQVEVIQLILLEAQSRWVIVDEPITPMGLRNLLIWVRAGWARNPAHRQELIKRFVHPHHSQQRFQSQTIRKLSATGVREG